MKMKMLLLVLSLIFGLLPCLHAAVPEDRIDSLPFFEGEVPFAHYSGYLTTREKQLHYWFVESEGNPSTDPLVLWLNGGPGCSSLYGFMFELGPFKFCDRGSEDLSLCLNDYSWNKIANVLFVESPVGVGFSYSPSSGDYYNNDTQTAIDNYAMLQDFFTKFPEYKNLPFYISGESYAGIYIPTLADEIRRGNAAGNNFINLQGFLVGNGVTEPSSDSVYNSLAPFSFGHGLIGISTMSKIEKCNGGETPTDPTCLLGISELSSHLSGINRYQIYDDCYYGNKKKEDIPWKSLKWGEEIMSDIPCINTDQASVYFNRRDVQIALHVEEIDWQICSNTLRYTKNYGSNSFQFYPELIENYRIVIFSGDTDAAVPHTGTELWTTKLGLPLLDDWHAWRVNNQIAGYAVIYEKLWYVSYKGGTHTVPESHPEESLHMLEKFFKNEPL